MGVPVTARKPVDFYPPSAQSEGKPVKIIVRVPTFFERDTYNAALVRAGIIYYSKEQIRELALAGASHLFGIDEFERNMSLLEQLWAAVDAQVVMRQRQSDALKAIYERNEALPEAERMPPSKIIEEMEAIKSEVEISDSVRVTAVALQQDIMARYTPIQKATADLVAMDSKRAWYNIRHYVTGWEGIEHKPDPVGESGLATHEVEYLRSQVGEDGFEQISDFITSMQYLDKDEEKNLALLLENMSDPTGSVPQSDQASSNGNGKTDTSGTPTPDGSSAKTAASSSGATKRSGKKTVASKPSPTAAPLATSL